jgi:hypothetical protein
MLAIVKWRRCVALCGAMSVDATIKVKHLAKENCEKTMSLIGESATDDVRIKLDSDDPSSTSPTTCYPSFLSTRKLEMTQFFL